MGETKAIPTNKTDLLNMDDESKRTFNKIAFKNTLNEYSKDSKRNVRLLIFFFVLGLSIMTYIFYSFPELREY
jgi:hypothetical protein